MRFVNSEVIISSEWGAWSIVMLIELFGDGCGGGLKVETEVETLFGRGRGRCYDESIILLLCLEPSYCNVFWEAMLRNIS